MLFLKFNDSTSDIIRNAAYAGSKYRRYDDICSRFCPKEFYKFILARG